MTAKEYLYQSLNIRESIKWRKDKIEELKARLGYHSVRLDDSGGSRGTPEEDQLGEIFARITELEKEYEKEILELELKNREIRENIEKLDNAEYINILSLRFLTTNKRNPNKPLTWVKIAVMLDIGSEDVVKKKYSRALKKFEKIYETSLNVPKERDNV